MFTFTKDELEQFLLSVITSFAGEDGVYDFSRVEDNTRQMVVNRAIAALEASQPQRDTLLENSLPAIDEDEINYDLDRRSVKEYSSHDFCPSCGSADLYLNTCFACGQKNISNFDEDNEFEATEPDAGDLPYPEFSLEIDDLEWQDNIPYSGQPIPYESDDDSPAELGLLPAA